MKLQTRVENINFKKILRDANGLCGICKKPFDLFGIDFDHIIPLARGGTHTADNIQATHSICNRRKGAKVG
jgi:5-methylcytosine-specific restriction endonuclease McrA